VILVGFYLFIALDAFVSARHLKEIVLSPYNRWYLYVALFLISNFAIQPLVGFMIKNNLLVAKPYKITSAGMEPALLAGDYLIAHMEYYRRNKPRRGDLILFSSPSDPTKDFLKRVIAFEGEKVEIIRDKIYINDQLIDDPWAYPGDGRPRNSIQQPENYGPGVVPKNCYFVLGDNRQSSLDSRVWGFLDGRKIKGKPLYIYWSRDKSRIGLVIK
jgi:signal peptidase I